MDIWGAVACVVVVGLIAFGIWKTRGKEPTGVKNTVGEDNDQ